MSSEEAIGTATMVDWKRLERGRLQRRLEHGHSSTALRMRSETLASLVPTGPAGPSASSTRSAAELARVAAYLMPHEQRGGGAVRNLRHRHLGSDEGADLVEMLVPVGGQVEEGDSLVLLESDKASMEVPAPAAGTVTAWLLEVGAAVKEGVVIARLAIDGAPVASAQSDGGASAAQPDSQRSGKQDHKKAQASAVTASAAISEKDATRLETQAGAAPSAPRSSAGAPQVA